MKKLLLFAILFLFIGCSNIDESSSKRNLRTTNNQREKKITLIL